MGGRGSSSGLGKTPNLEYKAMPYAITTGYSKYATQAERKEATATVSSFIKNMRVGDVYQAQGAFDGGTFEISKQGGKLMIGYVNSRYRPVVASRANIQKYIKNGAKLIKRG